MIYIGLGVGLNIVRSDDMFTCVMNSVLCDDDEHGWNVDEVYDGLLIEISTVPPMILE